MNRRNILLLINKGKVDQGNVVLLMLGLGTVNAWTRMWSTVILNILCWILSWRNQKANERMNITAESNTIHPERLKTMCKGLLMVPISHIPCTCSYVFRFDGTKSVDVKCV